MGRKMPEIDVRKPERFKYFKMIDELRAWLRPVGTQRDRASNRDLFFDQYAVLVLLYFFNPTVSSLRGLQKFATLEKLHKLCGIRPTALGSLSEASRVFDPAALEPIIAEPGVGVVAGQDSSGRQNARRSWSVRRRAAAGHRHSRQRVRTRPVATHDH